MKELLLSNGKTIPSLAYGTWLIKNEDAGKCVEIALRNGYRHIDTAQAYGNEVGIGEGIRASGLPREEIYITTKVMAEIKNYKKAKASIDESLKKLGVDYIDLILIHCPQPWILFRGPKKFYKENVEVWRALEEAYKEGKVRAIGVSNFLVKDLQNIIDHCEIKPMVNQILLHIGEVPVDVVKYCAENNIVVESYSPIAHGRALNDKKIQLMADKYGVSVPQLCIKFTLQLDTVSIPKASKEEHIISNTKLDFEIKEEDMVELMNLNGVDYGQDALWPVFNKRRNRE